MTAPALARKARQGEPGYETGGRVYEHPVTGEVVPSITAVISMIDKPALKFWAARRCAEYAADNLDSLGLLDQDARVKAIKAAPWRESGEASENGDVVHDWIDRIIKGGSINSTELGAATVTARRMLASFLKFQDKYKPEWLASEFTVFSHKYGYAGTGDWAARIGQWTVLGDTKTGKAVYPEVGLQTVALARADVIVTPDGKETPMPVFNRLAVLHVRPTFADLYQLNNPDECWNAFLAARELKRWKDYAAGGTVGARSRTESPIGKVA